MATNGNNGGENHGTVTQPTVFVCKKTLKSKYKCKLELYLGEDILLFSNGDLQICMENVCPIPLEFLDALY